MAGFAPLHPYLSDQLQAGQVSHAYIFGGAEAARQATAFSAALECSQRQESGNACGHCHACVNVEAGSHPDVRWWQPQDSLHRVEPIRDLVRDASRSRMAGPYKVYILPQAEKMRAEAANTMLKLLEEPIPATVLLLLTEHPEQLLPTIRSRCQLFVFNADLAPSEPLCPPELEAEALALLERLPGLELWQVLESSRDHVNDREELRGFFYGLLRQLHRAACGQLRLPMRYDNILNSAAVLEKALEALAGNVNGKLLADVVYLRLRQNCAE